MKQATQKYGKNVKEHFLIFLPVVFLLSACIADRLVTNPVIPPGWDYARQDSSGVYLTPTDFQNQKLAYAINCEARKPKIKFARFSLRSYIKVIRNDSTYTLSKDKIFGYHDCKGNSFRFIDGKSYTILNPTGYILLYMYGVPNHHEEIVDYRFSRGADGVVMELSKENLKKAFPENRDFQQKIDQIFGSRLELTAYDEGHRMYVVNWLYARVKDE